MRSVLRLCLKRDADRVATCDSCNWSGSAGLSLADVPVEWFCENPGEIVPCGACPNCGDPVYYVDSNIDHDAAERLAQIDWNTIEIRLRRIKMTVDRLMRLASLNAPKIILFNEARMGRDRLDEYTRLINDDPNEPFPDETMERLKRAAHHRLRTYQRKGLRVFSGWSDGEIDALTVMLLSPSPPEDTIGAVQGEA